MDDSWEKLLEKAKIPHTVLNAKQHEQEGNIIADAGRKGAVTIATNMAGRGVDIQLTPETLELGGLAIIGTERHESRRIDNQLRGRSGRQGDPGESRFYISLQDDLMRRFQGERIESIMNKLNLPDEERIEQSMVTKSIERAQAQVESLNFEIRKNVLKFDQVLNQQREVIYRWRRQLLRSDSIENLISEWFDDVVSTISNNIELHKKNYENLEHFNELVSDELSNLLSDGVKKEFVRNIEINDQLQIDHDLENLFNNNESQDFDTFWKLARGSSLSFVDQSWKDHLAEVDALRQGIGLRSYASKNPKLEFRRESFELFESLLNKIRLEGIRFLSRVEIELEDSGGLNLPKHNTQQTMSHQSPQSALSSPKQEEAPKEQGNRRLRRAEAKMARKNARKK